MNRRANYCEDNAYQINKKLSSILYAFSGIRIIKGSIQNRLVDIHFKGTGHMAKCPSCGKRSS